jgi:hypothetical protein
LACLGRHTVTGALCATGRQAFDWSAEYRVFSKAPWRVEDLFAPILGGVLDSLPGDAPVVMALEDTLIRKTGAKIPGTGYKRDPLSPKFHTNFVWGQPALAVASYAILLLAGDRVFRGRQTRGAVPLPKWQHKDPQQRMSTQELLRQLRSEVWRYAMDHGEMDSEPFVTEPFVVTKSSELPSPPAAVLLYAATN